MTGNPEDALDISQEAFFKAYQQLGAFRGESRFSVWMYRLTYNLCIDFLRKRKKTITSSLTYQDDTGESLDLELPDTRELPEETLQREETSVIINKSIEELDTIHREIIYMREISHMSYIDIATTLNISEGTVKSRLARARNNLANILLSKGTFPAGFRQNECKTQKEVGKRE
jgi:RNA polymerase sigma-70 factor (ECF subfamily)